MTLTSKPWAISGYRTRSMTLSGELADTYLALRFLIIGTYDILYSPKPVLTSCRWDTSKFILEHYVDGDLVDDTTPIGRSEAGPDNLHIWGPPLPPTFLL
jgi:hypothetical protein